MNCNLLIVILSAVWIGAVVGVSLIATPVKFRAPSLTRPIALEVGKVTFALFTRIEWAMFLLLALPILLCVQELLMLIVLLSLLSIVCAQSFWLLPVLAKRADAVAADNVTLPKSRVHRLYVLAELGKLVLLMVLIWNSWSATSGQAGL